VPLKILVVDDDEYLLTTLQLFLSRWGYGVVTTNSGSEAMQILKTDVFDLLLTDLEMPCVTGLDLLKSVQSTNPTILTVLMTGSEEIEKAEEALKSGAFDYLFKPFGLGQLKMTLLRAMKYRQVLLQEKGETTMGNLENGEQILEGMVRRPDPGRKSCLVGFQPKDHPATIYYLVGIPMENVEYLVNREVKLKGAVFSKAGVIQVSTIEAVENR
jgi:CheY-like chemotaxis protein